MLTQRMVRPAEFRGFVELRAADLGLTIEQAIEPECFSAKQSLINAQTVLRLVGSNGTCWATVTGISPLGNLIIELDWHPAPEPHRLQAAFDAARPARQPRALS